MEKTYFKSREDKPVIHRTPVSSTPRKPLVEGGTYRFVNGHLELLDAPKSIKEEFGIKVGGTYRSRDGRKIQVWAINNGSVDKPVLGMINTDGEWKAWYWNMKGTAKIPYGPHNDIVAEWSEG